MSSNYLNKLEEIDILKYNLLKKEYKILSLILANLQIIIIDNENILLYSKNQSMKSLNELIKKLNDLYNKSFLDIYNKDNEHLLNNESMYSEIGDIKSEENKTNKSVESVESNDSNNLDKLQKDNGILSSEILQTVNKLDAKNKSSQDNLIKKRLNNKEDLECNLNLEILNDIKNIYSQEDKFNNYGKYSYLVNLIKYNPFEEIKNQIILLSKIVGFTSIKDIIYLSLNKNDFVFEKKDKSLYELLSSIFIPLDFDILDCTEKININISKLESTNTILFDCKCLINFTINNKLLKIKGFIKNDPLNIFLRTSQISNNFLYLKKCNFEKLINEIDKEPCDLIITRDTYYKLQKINKEFAIVYLKNMTICEILILDSTQFVLKLYEDYNKFNELTKIQFVKLIKNFTKDSNENLYNMYNTIRLLLLGTEENCSVASLLFNLLKDKKSTNSN